MTVAAQQSTAITPSAKPLIRPALVALAIAGTTELTLQRTFYRLGIYIPKHGTLWDIYRVSTRVGTFALNLASILSLVVLGLIAIGLWRTERRRTATLLGLLVLVSLVSLALTSNLWLSVAYRATFIVVAAAVLVSAPSKPPRDVRATSIGLLCAYGLSSYYGLVGGVMMALGMPGRPWGAAVALRLGEVVVVALGPLIFLAWKRHASIHVGRTLAWAGLPTVVLLAALTFQPRMTGILVMWTAGLGLALPLPLYVISFWLFTTALIGSLAHSETRVQGVALVLLLVAGYFPQSTYELVVAVVALSLWAEPTALDVNA